MRTKPHAKICRRPLSAIKPLQFNIYLLISVSLFCGIGHSADSTPQLATVNAVDTAIVIGFVGGRVRHDDHRHAEVLLGEKLRADYGGRAHVGIFENRREEDARRLILKWLDKDSDGNLSASEKRQARIIIYGHSWGASAVVELARELQKDRIPVLLTIQVDSISKPGQDDHLIPANVARAVNFYQTGGIFHGLPKIVPADPLQTQIVGDFRLQYQKQPEPCSTYPWFARHFMKGHTSIECDPNVWSRIETLISELLPPKDTTLTRNFQ